MRKRSKYRPKEMLLNPVSFVIENIQPIAKHDSYLVDLKIKNSSAMVNLLQGSATKKDMDTLIAMSNITEALQRMGFGKDYKDVAVGGREAILSIVIRAVDRRKFTPTGPEITALNLLMELHDAQMDVITVKDMDAAIKLARSLLANKQATKLPFISEELK
jgi:hypothetical protein